MREKHTLSYGWKPTTSYVLIVRQQNQLVCCTTTSSYRFVTKIENLNAATVFIFNKTPKANSIITSRNLWDSASYCICSRSSSFLSRGEQSSRFRETGELYLVAFGAFAIQQSPFGFNGSSCPNRSRVQCRMRACYLNSKNSFKCMSIRLNFVFRLQTMITHSVGIDI